MRESKVRRAIGERVPKGALKLAPEMSLGRRKIRLEDASSWVFNQMAEAYAARPPYPSALLDELTRVAGPEVRRVLDIGAGIGHLALPLAERGLDVVCVEPAQAMLVALETAARERGLTLQALHAAAEQLPLPANSFDFVIVSDAIHFLDKELAAAEIARVLTANGALAMVTCELGNTPFMRGLVKIMEAAAPRRPREVTAAIEQFAALARTPLAPPRVFDDDTPVDLATLELILRSISFIGPAMTRERFSAFMKNVHALDSAPVWARTFTLYAGRRGRYRSDFTAVRELG